MLNASSLLAESFPRRRIVWVPHPGSQQFFLSCPVFEVLYEGTRGPGKTEALLVDFIQHVGKGFGDHWRGILFRQTYKQLSDVVAKSKRLFRRAFPDARFNGSDFCWRFATGESLYFRHMRTIDDYDNYHGHEYPWIGWEELTNWATADCYEAMKSCCRSSRQDMPRKYRATCNPFGVGHNWVKLYFIDPAPRGTVVYNREGLARVAIHGFLDENLTLIEADPHYKAKLAATKSVPKRKAWLYGDWDIASGGMFDDVWDSDYHLIPPFTVPSHWYVNRSFDWGSSRPFSVGWWAESDGSSVRLANGEHRTFPRGTLFRINEWYGWNGEPNVGSHMLATQIADGIIEREQSMSLYDICNAGPADSSIWDEVNGNCIARDMSTRGVDWIAANKGPGSRKNGWELIRIRLANADTPEKRSEDPAIYIFDKTLLPSICDVKLRNFGECENFKRTFPYLPRDSSDMDDVDTNAEDHIADEVRYRILAAPDLVSQHDVFPEGSAFGRSH